MLSELNKEDYAYTDKHMRPQTRPLPCSLPLPAQDSPQDGRAQRLQEHVDLSVDMHVSRDSRPGGVLSVSLETGMRFICELVLATLDMKSLLRSLEPDHHGVEFFEGTTSRVGERRYWRSRG